MSIVLDLGHCAFCAGDGCSACDELAEPCCEQCGAPTAASCECSGYEASDADDVHGRPDYAPDAGGRW